MATFELTLREDAPLPTLPKTRKDRRRTVMGRIMEMTTSASCFRYPMALKSLDDLFVGTCHVAQLSRDVV